MNLIALYAISILLLFPLMISFRSFKEVFYVELLIRIMGCFNKIPNFNLHSVMVAIWPQLPYEVFGLIVTLIHVLAIHVLPVYMRFCLDFKG